MSCPDKERFMAHIFLSHAYHDHAFAEQLAIQLQQRGFVVQPVPSVDIGTPPKPAGTGRLLETATHVVIILSPQATVSDDVLREWDRILERGPQIILVLYQPIEIPERLQSYPVVDFRGTFLLGVEDLVERLKRASAPTRQLTIEHPPPVVKIGLLPHILPPERCLREDRIRINYTLPMIMPGEELAHRMPGFYAATGFQLFESGHSSLKARRIYQYRLFDPRRADQILTVETIEGGLRAYYQMTRMQVLYWFPAQYRTLDREAAALYRYLATGSLDNSLDSVEQQARLAQAVSWTVLIVLLLGLTVFILLLLDELFGVSVF
jgi:hypothetical protein